MNKEEAERLLALLKDLGWEYQRMSRDGQETLDQIYAMVGIEPMEDSSVSVEANMKAMQSKTWLEDNMITDPDDIEFEKNVFINRIKGNND
tara:strand:+ start:273 stop:545 length:273 start_codon:yes stop_codon:yes gene_type:complete